jgi:hypothetical protein
MEMALSGGYEGDVSKMERALHPRSEELGMTWWVRLHSLYKDRAFLMEPDFGIEEYHNLRSLTHFLESS